VRSLPAPKERHDKDKWSKQNREGAWARERVRFGYPPFWVSCPLGILPLGILPFGYPPFGRTRFARLTAGRPVRRAVKPVRRAVKTADRRAALWLRAQKKPRPKRLANQLALRSQTRFVRISEQTAPRLAFRSYSRRNRAPPCVSFVFPNKPRPAVRVAVLTRKAASLEKSCLEY